jgi:hypothetical protein
MCNYLPSKKEMMYIVWILILKPTAKPSLIYCIYYNFLYYRNKSIYLYVLAQNLHEFVNNSGLQLEYIVVIKKTFRYSNVFLQPYNRLCRTSEFQNIIMENRMSTTRRQVGF